MVVPAGRGAWPLHGRIGFRFAFLFWAIFCLTSRGSDLLLWFWPWLSRHVAAALNWPLEKMSIWAGHHIFHLTGEAAAPHPTGSGDTALAWIGELCLIAAALLGCALWSAVSEMRGRRKEYHALYAWLRLLMRFVLALTLLSYGFYKVFPMQMPPPSTITLNETYGASSPMLLAWTFLGASPTYRIFAGLCEVIPGLLLLFRRTTTVGALGAAAVMLNVLMMNMSYDIPVKLFSAMLLLMALFLLAPDLQPMWRFFLARREALLTGVWLPRVERKPLRIATYCLQAVTIGYVLYATGWSTWKDWRLAQTPLKGNWVVDDAQGPPADMHWQTVLVDNPFMIRGGPTGKLQRYYVTYLPKQNTVEMRGPFKDDGPGDLQGQLRWNDAGGGKMMLTGSWFGRPTSVAMHRVPPPQFLLMTRGFHWVQEYPYNK